MQLREKSPPNCPAKFGAEKLRKNLETASYCSLDWSCLVHGGLEILTKRSSRAERTRQQGWLTNPVLFREEYQQRLKTGTPG